MAKIKEAQSSESFLDNKSKIPLQDLTVKCSVNKETEICYFGHEVRINELIHMGSSLVRNLFHPDTDLSILQKKVTLPADEHSIPMARIKVNRVTRTSPRRITKLFTLLSRSA